MINQSQVSKSIGADQAEIINLLKIARQKQKESPKFKPLSGSLTLSDLNIHEGYWGICSKAHLAKVTLGDFLNGTLVGQLKGKGFTSENLRVGDFNYYVKSFSDLADELFEFLLKAQSEPEKNPDAVLIFIHDVMTMCLYVISLMKNTGCNNYQVDWDELLSRPNL